MASGVTFRKAVAVMFGAYYVFNIAYQEEAGGTLEFIQRYMMDFYGILFKIKCSSL